MTRWKRYEKQKRRPMAAVRMFVKTKTYASLMSVAFSLPLRPVSSS